MIPRTRVSKKIIDGLWDLFVMLKYPKVLMMTGMVFLAFLLFQDEGVQSFFHRLDNLGYASAFFGGMLFAFGFGAPFGVAMLLTLANDVYVPIAAVIGGLGALTSDYLLFKFIRLTFQDEIDRFVGSKSFKMLDGLMRRRMPPRLVYYISLGVAGLVISSPLPDEFGVALMAGLTKIGTKTFAIICFSLNTVGILAVLMIGAAV